MKNTYWITIVSILLGPICIWAEDNKPEANVNERYAVESIVYSNIDESKISQPLREEAQKMVGQRYNEKTANDIRKKIQNDLKTHSEDYWIYLKVEKGSSPDKVKIVYEFKKKMGGAVGFNFDYNYRSDLGMSANLGITATDLTYHNVFGFNVLTDANLPLERYSGIQASYENQKVGTDKVRLRLQFDSYHEKYNPATKSALALRSDLPGISRSRQNFAPTLTLIPIKNLTFSAGLSFQRIEFQLPYHRYETAYSGVGGLTFNQNLKPLGEYKQKLDINYHIHSATRILDSDFVYTDQWMFTNYSLSNDANEFSAHLFWGVISGNPPLFERFALGNSLALRGWNKFDISPIGGTRAVNGSLEYRYRHFRVFYDVGTEWDKGKFSPIRHDIGFGITGWPHKWFPNISIAFPIRLHNVEPIFGTF
jgi:hypothetical protein